jgi:hypothetical protein
MPGFFLFVAISHCCSAPFYRDNPVQLIDSAVPGGLSHLEVDPLAAHLEGGSVACWNLVSG